MHAIEVNRLHKHFGPLHAVNDISFSVDRGDVLGFLGPNGAGKSTTMKMIAGFIEPSAGAVSVCGKNVVDFPIEAKEKIGYLPEGAPLYGEMTPAAFLAFIADVRGLDSKRREQRINEVVSKIHLEGVMHQRIETLSKGYKRRVGLAQAILHDPEVLILDEPTDGLDPNQKHEVRALIHTMARDKAIIISTHILEEVDAVCTKAIIIAQGKLLFHGTPKELAQRSATYNAVLLSVKTDLAEAIRQRLDALPGIESSAVTPADDGHSHIVVCPKNGAAIVNAVAELVRAEGWEVAELRVDSGRLDEVFRTITQPTAATAKQVPA
jgi:ABC-2 type transport system ATP-binding protein